MATMTSLEVCHDLFQQWQAILDSQPEGDSKEAQFAARTIAIIYQATEGMVQTLREFGMEPTAPLIAAMFVGQQCEVKWRSQGRSPIQDEAGKLMATILGGQVDMTGDFPFMTLALGCLASRFVMGDI